MKKLYTIVLLFVAVNILWQTPLAAQAPVINAVTADKSTVGRFEKVELSVSFTGTYTNPYDYDDILVRGIFTTPSGRKDTMEGFYMEGYTLNTTTGNIAPTGSNSFKVRYAPGETGTYSYTVTCTNPSGTATSSAGSFEVAASGKKGFVRKNASNYLSFDNGEQYIPIGQNLAWQQNNKYLDFKNWTDRLAASKANFIRLWQCAWGLGIEWTGTPYNGLKHYSQVNSFYTDKLLDECSAKDIYVMLCINHHGMVSTTVNPNWNESPYNAANGGPCTRTLDYFTSSTAKNLHKNRLRYIVARWGYSRNIMSWELFNEVDWTDNFSANKSAVKNWHLEMADYLKSIDPVKHLVTTSYANYAEDPNTWNGTSIDLTQTHFYTPSANIETILSDGSRSYLTQFGKPTLNAEYGINTAQSIFSSIDPRGIYVHNSVWGTLFSGAMGGGASWWWDTYIDPQNLYVHYKAPATVVANIPLASQNFKPVTGTVTGAGSSETTISPAFGWGKAPAASFTIDGSGAMSPSAANLGQYVYGVECKSAERNPPTFSVNLPAAGQFKLTTADLSSYCTAQKVLIKLDGTEAINVAAVANTTYAINVPAGTHTITVDNGGGDWYRVSSFTFTNVGSSLNTYLLKSNDNQRVAGWVHNKKYNWVDAGPSGSTPPAVSGATLTISGMANGNYDITWYECVNGTATSSTSATVTGGVLSLPVPTIAWDAAFTATAGSVITAVPAVAHATGGRVIVFPNPVHEQLYLKIHETGIQRGLVMVFDNLGNKLLSKPVVYNSTSLPSVPVAFLPAGLYYFQLVDNKGQNIGSLKFTKQ